MAKMEGSENSPWPSAHTQNKGFNTLGKQKHQDRQARPSRWAKHSLALKCRSLPEMWSKENKQASLIIVLHWNVYCLAFTLKCCSSEQRKRYTSVQSSLGEGSSGCDGCLPSDTTPYSCECRALLSGLLSRVSKGGCAEILTFKYHNKKAQGAVLFQALRTWQMPHTHTTHTREKNIWQWFRSWFDLMWFKLSETIPD